MKIVLLVDALTDLVLAGAGSYVYFYYKDDTILALTSAYVALGSVIMSGRKIYKYMTDDR